MFNKFLDLGWQPLANNYLNKNKLKNKENFYKLSVGFNKKNYLVSILKTINSKLIYNKYYPYRASMSLTMKKSFKLLSLKIKKKFYFKKIIEIGSNDGCFVKNFPKKKVIGVEPCKNLANITKKLGYETYNEFWNYNLIKKIKKKYGRIDLIYSANTLSHIKNINSVFNCINLVFNKDRRLIKFSYDALYL
jgi:hypothetical protein